MIDVHIHIIALSRTQAKKGRKGDRKEKMRNKNKRERAGKGKGGKHAGICVRGQDEFKRLEARSAHHASGRQITGLQDTHPGRISHSTNLRHL